MSLPIIDLKKLDAAEIVRELRRACERDGFFLIRNHSVPREVVLDMKQASKAFFELPVEEKMKVYANKDNRGYTPFKQETLQQGTLGDSKEGYYIGRECSDSEVGLQLRSKNQWPEQGQFKEKMERYYGSLVEMCESFMPAFALALGLDADFFDDKFKPHNALLRPLKYGKVKSEGMQFGAGAHSDYGVLTVLWVEDGSEGLEIQNKDGSWMRVQMPKKEEGETCDFICNIGDLMQFWTNDRFKSTVHRVVTDGTKERYSAAFFYEPSYECQVVPILMNPDEKPKYEAQTFLKYILGKYAKTHEHMAEEGADK